MNTKFELTNVLCNELKQSFACKFKGILGYSLTDRLSDDIDDAIMCRAISHGIEVVLYDAVQQPTS